MKKAFLIITVILCSAACTKNSDQLIIDSSWKREVMQDLNIELDLPISRIISEERITIESSNYVGMHVQSSLDTNAEDFFSFLLVETTASPELGKLQYCNESAVAQSTITTRHAVFSFYKCKRPSYAFEINQRRYLLLLPQGDWGQESEKPFRQLLESIQATNAN